MLRLAAPKRLFRGLLVTVGVLVLAGVVSKLMESGLLYEFSSTFMQQFDLDRERNIPSWFSSLLLFTNALLLALIAGEMLQMHERWWLHWCGLAFIFLMFSLDETVSFHERTIEPIREAFDLSGPFFFAWVIPAMVLLAVFGALYLRFTLALPRRTLWLFALAAVLYIGGALGIEMLGGMYGSRAAGKWNEVLVYGLITLVEESLEMLGQVVFFYGLMDYIQSKWWAIQIRNSSSASQPP